MAIFTPAYFAPISQYAAIIKSENVVFEIEENFQKQTYRNRCYIYGANGKQLLSIPVKHPITEGRKKTKDTLIEHNFSWQREHFKSFQSSYRSSPFFDFFEDELALLLNKKHKYLIDLTIDSHLFVTDAIQSSQKFSKTKTYEITPELEDYRNLVSIKNNFKTIIPEYVQVFDDKHGFITNLSILDLLFMEGGNTSSFLENITIKNSLYL